MTKKKGRKPMWNAFITTSNQNININISECLGFDKNWNSTDAYNYVMYQLENNLPFITPTEAIHIKDKKSVKNIRVHWKSSILSA